MKRKLSEYGTGFSGMSGVRGGAINRGGYGGGNMSGQNTMYVYTIKSLNHSLEPETNDSETEEILTIGKLVKGIELNKRNDKYLQGIITKIDKSPAGVINFYVIMDPKTSTLVKLDPSTVLRIDKNSYTDPLDIVSKRNEEDNMKEKLKTEKIKENRFVSENLEDFMNENLNESEQEYICNSCGEISYHQEGNKPICPDCGGSNLEREY
jgi:rubrerythrin